MWLISLANYLAMAHQGVVQVSQLVEAVRAGRGAVHDDDGMVITPDQLEASYQRLVAHAGEVGDDFLADLAADVRAGHV